MTEFDCTPCARYARCHSMHKNTQKAAVCFLRKPTTGPSRRSSELFLNASDRPTPYHLNHTDNPDVIDSDF